ncbi:MAG: hypothetical protein RLZZ584_2129, partial [Pseudomonadota bacterium]
MAGGAADRNSRKRAGGVHHEVRYLRLLWQVDRPAPPPEFPRLTSSSTPAAGATTPAPGHAALPRPVLASDALMLLAAMIWGSTFVAQHLGMAGVGPFFYTGSRFLLGAALVLPLWRWRPAWLGQPLPCGQHGAGGRSLWLAGLGLGLVLFAGVNAQQVGLLGTTVSNAGFITGLYVVIVPFMLLGMGQRMQTSLWAAVALAATGLYLLSVKA